VTSTGTGTSVTITDLPSGIYNYTVANADGCLSVLSTNIVIPAQPYPPTAPVVGTITQPTFSVPFGSVVLSGLPSGTWVLTRLPGDVTTTGTGSSRIISDLLGGLYTFTVANSSECISAESAEVIISTPGIPLVIITDPPAACFPDTVDLTDPSIKEGSTTGLTFSYWTDSLATVPYSTPSLADSGTYYIKGTTVSGYFDIKPVLVTIDHIAVPFAGEDQMLEYVLESAMEAELTDDYETGVWSVLSGTGEFIDTTYAKTTVSGLSLGENQFFWKVTRGACPPSYDTVSIIVNDLKVPTLITPNMDGRNDYFVIRGLSTLGKTELIIFDRRGTQVYKTTDYDNKWNGIDYNENPLPDDTYFYVLRSRSGKSISGYIVIRR
jgi:gliding motility-associated-like protein